MAPRKLKVVVGGMFARVPDQGGLAWVVLQYVLGLGRLGHEVLLVEPVGRSDLRPPGATLAESHNAASFRGVVDGFGLVGSASLLLEGSNRAVGLSWQEARSFAEGADLLINIAGSLTDAALVEPVPTRLYLDLDPGFTQLWHVVEGIDMRFAGHTHFASVGLCMDRPESRVPSCGIDWIPTPQPVVLAEWPFADRLERRALTTVANWRGYGSIEADGNFYGQKAHSLRPLIELPTRTSARFELALAIDPGETADLEALDDNGWHLADPLVVAGSPEAYRRFIQGSWAEFGVAKSGYVEGGSGWFSDRSACYLASGRPVLAHETGFSERLPVGRGLLAFRDARGFEVALDALERDYEGHRRAARAIAEEFFASDVVLPRLLARVGAVA